MSKSDLQIVIIVAKRAVLFLVLAALSGCGVETATTATTAASIKAKEVEGAKKTQEQFRQKLDQGMQQADQRREEK